MIFQVVMILNDQLFVDISIIVIVVQQKERVEREYYLEREAAQKEFEEKKIELKENLISDLEEKKRIIEAERNNMELTGGILLSFMLKCISFFKKYHGNCSSVHFGDQHSI